MQPSLKLAAEKSQAERRRKKADPREKMPFRPDPEHGAVNRQAAAGRRILVADDNPVVLKAFELKLKSSGFIVSTVQRPGSVASTAVESGAELIVMDVHFADNQPNWVDWSGFTIMEWMRRFQELAYIPVILITGDEDSVYRDKALEAGAVAFFQKPVDYKELTAAIIQALDPIPT